MKIILLANKKFAEIWVYQEWVLINNYTQIINDPQDKWCTASNGYETETQEKHQRTAYWCWYIEHKAVWMMHFTVFRHVYFVLIQWMF